MAQAAILINQTNRWTMARTLFLLPDPWDLALDTDGNIATATSTYQRAQDIASKCRVFIQDLYYQQSAGIPYLESILGKNTYPIGLYQSELYKAAMSVDGVVSVNIKLNQLSDRKLTGMIEFTDIEGNSATVGL